MPNSEQLLRFPYSIIRPVYEKTSFHREVIEEIKNPRLQWAYTHCRQITRQFARTFYLSTRFLPHEKQRSIFAVYALCRYMDNLVDDAEDLARDTKIAENEVGTLLQNCKNELHQAYRDQDSDNPIFVAFADVLTRYHIPIELPFQLMDGVCMDLTKNRYQNFEELYDYSYKVASVVGLMTSEIFGYSSKQALPHAIDLGIAMQLTNILRDVGEDVDRNRIYLPLDECAAFGVSEEDILNKNKTSDFVALIKFQIERARRYYESADEGIPMLQKDARLPVYLARYNYSRILGRIEENDYQVFHKRAHLSLAEKLSIIPKIWWRSTL